MSMSHRLVFIGPCGGGKIPTNGASAKNFQIINYFKSNGADVSIIDTELWKKNPLVLIRLFLSLFIYHGRYIVSANNTSSYRLLSVLTKLPFREFVAYWVIGGSIGDWVKEGKVADKPFKKVDLILVEGERMKRVFSECGIERVKVVPNFKKIDFIPKKSFNEGDKVKFVFLSRIIRDKGVDIIIEAVKKLNKRKAGYLVDFYGPFESSYKDEFLTSIEGIDNIRYKGFLNLNETSNYQELSQYDVMLFPTYWHGEGFPGIVIDAFVAGLPVIATEWSMNGELIKDGVTGWLIPPLDAEALANVMEGIMDNKETLRSKSIACQESARRYDINNVINNELLVKLGILN